jgi:hypothetical protein
MQTIEKQAFIRMKARENLHIYEARKILWSRHAVAALIDDGLSRIDIEAVLPQAEIIEDYPPTHRPLPDCLVLAMLSSNRPIHAVIAIDESNGRIFIVTVYLPTSDRWQDDWRTRKP